MDRWKAATLVLLGVVLGMGYDGFAHARDPLAEGVSYSPRSGGWHCYVLDKIMASGIVRQDADLVDSAEWSNSKKMTGFFNLVSPDTPTGTVVTFPAPNSAPMACVKNANP